MAGEFQEFTAELDREMEAFKGEIRETTQQIALDGYNGVVVRTPVDTGFARNSWFVDLGDGASRESNGGTSSAAEDAATIKSAPAFTPITIANGAEYIGVLENGHSQQAPNGMVSVTIAELRSKYRRVR